MTQVQKKAGAFRTIREVADHLNVEQHVLRFWETKFSQIKPLKRGGGRRYYRPEDVIVLERIYDLLYRERYTIKGAQKVLKGSTRNQIAVASNSNIKWEGQEAYQQPTPQQQSSATATPAPSAVGFNERQIDALQQTLEALKSMRDILQKS